MKKILLFDVDGTLLDFHAAETCALDQLMNDCKITDKENALNTYHRINSALWKRIEEGTITQSRLKIQRFEEFIDEMKLDFEADTLAQVFMDFLSKGTQLIDYAYETLESLSQKYDCHIVTNGITYIQKNRISHSSIYPFIKELFISEEMGVSKPDPKYFDIVRQKLNPDTDDLLIVIGDSLSSDMQGALLSNLKCIWYNPKHLKTELKLDGIISDLRELEKVIEQI